MTFHAYVLTPDRLPAVHPSAMVVNLPTGLTGATCVYCGSSFTINSTDGPQRILPGRDTLLVMSRP